MFYPGLVSISFREHSPERIARSSAECGLKFVEWGSDVHAPYHDIARLEKLKNLQENYGIRCCSYGTYFRLGYTPLDELPLYIQAAKILGTNTLRLWAGRKKAADCTEEERKYFFSQCRQAAEIAKEHDVILCLECHRRSYTETMEGALELMQAIQSPHFRMYWQPNPDISKAENLAYITLLKPYITHVHVFHWTAQERLSLSEGIQDWKAYLSALSGEYHLLLEFMPDDSIQSLRKEADALHAILQIVNSKAQ